MEKVYVGGISRLLANIHNGQMTVFHFENFFLNSAVNANQMIGFPRLLRLVMREISPVLVQWADFGWHLLTNYPRVAGISA